MELVQVRRHFTDDTAISDLSLAGQHICYLLESDNCISIGRYQVVIDTDTDALALLNVRDFESVRILPELIHSLNGSMVTGQSRATGQVGSTKEAYTKLHSMITRALSDGEEVYLNIYKEG
jgi:hypothetical protein